MTRWFIELRQAGRSLARAPGFTLLAVLSLALGLGLTTAVFTVVKQVILDPLGYPDAGRLVILTSAVPKSGMAAEWGIASAQYFHIGDNAASLADIGAMTTYPVTVAASGGYFGARVAEATSGMHRLIGARPLLGRRLVQSDDGSDEPTLAVVSHGFWERRLGADPDVVGRTLRFDPGIVGHALTDDEQARMTLRIVGVLEPVTGVLDADLWIPARLGRAGPHYNQHTWLVLAKLADGVGIDQARSEITTLTDQLVDAYPQVYSREFVEQYGFRTVAYDAKAYVIGDVAGILWLLQAAAALLLVVAWADVVYLLLARGETRRGDFAVRAAVGARWRDIARHHAVVGFLLTVPGLLLGVLIAWGAVAYIVAAAPVPVPRLDEAELDLGVLTFLLLLSAAVIAALASLPTFYSHDFRADLTDAGRSATVGRQRARARAGMMAGQVAVTMVLVTAAGLLLESFRVLVNTDPGIDPDGVVTVAVTPNASHIDGGTWWRLVKQVQQRLEALPGVVVAGASSALPLQGFPGCAAQEFDDPAVDERIGDSAFTSCASVLLTTPGWFRAMGIPVLKGRALVLADLDDPQRASVVVSHAFADRFWPDESPIGERIAAYGGGWYTIVGVAGDVYAAAVRDAPAVAAYYPLNPLPNGRWPGYSVTMAIRTEFERPSAILPAVMEAFDGVDPDIRVESPATMSEVISRSMAPMSFALTLLATVAAGALVLAVAGLYGVVAHRAARRTQEMGVRMALGARAPQVQRLLAFSILRVVAIGLGLGTLASLAAGGALRGLLFGVSPTDPATFLLAALLLALAALAAGWIAARRAARTSPMAALRTE